jgi:iron complex transport system ATP-binding protein
MISGETPSKIPVTGGAPPALRVSGLVFRRGRDILKGVDWTVRPGEHWCVLGANGCGKTTLINLVTGYDAATAGEIQLGASRFGRADWREVRKRVGLVTNTLSTFLEPGEPVLDAVVSGRDAMLNLVGEVPAGWRAEAAALLEQAGCGHLSEAFWGTLSQGEKQKILICRALMTRFEILILDEPCAGLDPVARERFLRWLGSLMRRPGSPALVLVTHHVEEILPEFSHVLLMRDGRALVSGPKNEVLTSSRLSEVYGAPVTLQAEGDRFRLALKEESGDSEAAHFS